MSSKISAMPKQIPLEDLSDQIFAITHTLGKIEGIVQERGYPGFPSGRELHHSSIVLEHFETHGPSINNLREELQKTYVRLRTISKELIDGFDPRVSEVFEKQIEILHEKRGRLEGSLREFEQTLNSDLLLKNIQTDLKSLQERVAQYESEQLPIDEWEVLNDVRSDLEVQMKILFPRSKREESHFYQTHFDKKKEIDSHLNVARLRLNFKHTKRLKALRMQTQSKIEILLSKLDEVVENLDQKLIGHNTILIQDNFSSLPLDFRIQFFKNADLVPERLNESLHKYTRLLDKTAERQTRSELVGVAYLNRERAEKEYRQLLRSTPSLATEEREKLKKELDEGLSQLPETLMVDRGKTRRIIEKTLVDLPHYKPESVVIRPSVKRKEIAQSALVNSAALSPASSVPKVDVFTEIRVKCKVPFGHTLTVRGQGGGLDWGCGKVLIQQDEETYVHRMEGVVGRVEYKILLDDHLWEGGTDRVIEAEKSQEITPSLPLPIVPIVVNFNESAKRLFIRGTGPGMSWDKGVELNYVNGKFVFECSEECGDFEFKVLIDNVHWSKEKENYKAQKGKTVEITPAF